MKYTIEIDNTALKKLKKLPKKVRDSIIQAIDELADTPKPKGYKKLKGSHKNKFRIRQGNYRIVYKIENSMLKILIIDLGHRKYICPGNIYINNSIKPV
jgi:mRNA interferase RelE/StbE